MPLKDPICGMAVTEKSFYHLEFEGVQHYFCGNKCKSRFAARTSQRAGHAGSPLAAAVALPRPDQRHWRRWLLLGLVLALGVGASWLTAHP